VTTFVAPVPRTASSGLHAERGVADGARRAACAPATPADVVRFQLQADRRVWIGLERVRDRAERVGGVILIEDRRMTLGLLGSRRRPHQAQAYKPWAWTLLTYTTIAFM
jgi:hypothetical protein